MHALRTAAGWLALGGLLVAGGGCRVSVSSDLPLESNAELIEHIAYMPYVNADAAWRSLYILKTREVPGGSFEEARAALAGTGVELPDVGPDECPDRTEIARVVHTICGIPGGLNYTLTGLGRYALRDLQYEGVVRVGRDYGPMTGGEFLGLLARAEELLAEQREAAERVELGEEPR